MRVGVDVGGTFTDVVGWDGERLAIAKVSTTADQSEGVVRGAAQAGSADRLLHGTTVATNALLERAGARTVLVTTEGFEDLLTIGRQDRPSLYDPEAHRPPALVVASVGLPREGSRADLADALATHRPEAVAVSLLYGFDRSDAEQRVADLVHSVFPRVPVSLSSAVAPEFREFERSSTTVLNAYLAPVTSSYLGRLRERVGKLPVSIMRSSGGLMSVERAAELPASILLSGPAGGVVAAAELGKAIGADRVVSFDMGGTSTDVCRIDHGAPEIAHQRTIDGHPCRMPAVAVHTVGAGGGSIAWSDAGGALRVGPASAGASPGPVSYGRGGTDPTVTDANVFLGRLGDTLADDVTLDVAAAETAMQRLGERLGLSVSATAMGIVDVVEAHMTRAIRRVTVEEGADPRGATLVAFGGAGGLHAGALARNLGMKDAIVPPQAGVFSAMGLLMAPPRTDLARSLAETTPASVLADLASLTDEARHLFRMDQGIEPGRVEAAVDVRYLGQAHETTVMVERTTDWEEIVRRFHALHAQRNGFARPGDPVEVVTIRATALGAPALGFEDLPSADPVGEMRRGERTALIDEEWRPIPVFDRRALHAGWSCTGPAIIAGPVSTTYVPPGFKAEAVEWGALRLTW